MYQDAFPDKYICKRSDFEPYSYAEFDGEMVGIPRNYHQILMNNYGDYMKLPPENERVNHAADVLEFLYGKLREKRHNFEFNYSEYIEQFCKLNEYCIICKEQLEIEKVKL